MPTKIPAEIELDEDAEIEMPDEPMMPQRKEYLWGTDLTGMRYSYEHAAS